MNKLDDIAFEAAKRLLRGGNEQVEIVDTCPALLDLAAMAKEMMLGSSHYRSQFPAVPSKDNGRTAD